MGSKVAGRLLQLMVIANFNLNAAKRPDWAAATVDCVVKFRDKAHHKCWPEASVQISNDTRSKWEIDGPASVRARTTN